MAEQELTPDQQVFWHRLRRTFAVAAAAQLLPVVLLFALTVYGVVAIGWGALFPLLILLAVLVFLGMYVLSGARMPERWARTAATTGALGGFVLGGVAAVALSVRLHSPVGALAFVLGPAVGVVLAWLPARTAARRLLASPADVLAGSFLEVPFPVRGTGNATLIAREKTLRLRVRYARGVGTAVMPDDVNEREIPYRRLTAVQVNHVSEARRLPLPGGRAWDTVAVATGDQVLLLRARDQQWELPFADCGRVADVVRRRMHQ